MKTLIVRSARLLLAAVSVLHLSGCVVQPEPRTRDLAAAEPQALPPPSTEIVFYPAAGQPAEQQDRDRYECYRWSVQQTGFDPAAPHVAPHQRVAVVTGAPPGTNVADSTITGALLGAAVSNPRSAGGGAIVGAIAGALLGAATNAGQQQQRQQIQRDLSEADGQQAARAEQQAANFRRAMGACLEGRGYTIK